MYFYKPAEYQDRCALSFASYSKILASLLPNALVEHVGSSSIAGAISKGDLDIYVGVKSDEHEAAIKILENAGFLIKPDTLRTPELCMLIADDDVAFQVVVIGSKYDFFVKFRDLLRNDAALVEQYNKLKLECSTYDEDLYRDMKSKFIESVLKSV